MATGDSNRTACVSRKELYRFSLRHASSDNKVKASFNGNVLKPGTFENARYPAVRLERLKTSEKAGSSAHKVERKAVENDISEKDFPFPVARSRRSPWNREGVERNPQLASSLQYAAHFPDAPWEIRVG